MSLISGSYFWSLILVWYNLVAFIDLYIRMSRVEKSRLISYLDRVEKEMKKKVAAEPNSIPVIQEDIDPEEEKETDDFLMISSKRKLIGGIKVKNGLKVKKENKLLDDSSNSIQEKNNSSVKFKKSSRYRNRSKNRKK
jgi:hypothetical protein